MCTWCKIGVSHWHDEFEAGSDRVVKSERVEAREAEALRVANEAVLEWRVQRALQRVLKDPKTWEVARRLDDFLWDLHDRGNPLDGLSLVDRWRDPSDPGPRGERRRREPEWRPSGSILSLDSWID